MTDLKALKERLVKELNAEVAKMEGKDLTPTCLDNIYKLIESIKGICKINMLEGENSGDGYSGRRYTYGYPYGYYARHDRMDQLEEELRRLMETAPNEAVRAALDRAIRDLR